MVLGIAGFFVSADFGEPGKVEDAFGIFAVNGWHNVLHIALGCLGLLAAGLAPRLFALAAGAFLLGLGIWGFAAGNGGTIQDLIPVNTADNLLHTVLGGLGLAAGITGMQRRKSRPKKRTRS